MWVRGITWALGHITRLLPGQNPRGRTPLFPFVPDRVAVHNAEVSRVSHLSPSRHSLLGKWVFLALAATLCSSVPGISIAQTDTERIKELERKLERSLKTIEGLSNRLKELEARAPGRQEAAPTSPAGEHEHESRVPVIGGETLPPPTLLKGFADV